MSTANKYSPQTNVLPPRCPHCDAELLEVATYQWVKQLAGGLGVMLCMYCPNAECRRILGTQIMIVPQAEERAIVGPH